ncbi:hypothetical protein [Arachidicoccus soli]|uniref:hypothetical protein n=1 Tax=Arachidicoccus soli TaxID=2341117 RepID=UPI0013C43CEF|nr:hypothetical protein [Arachidicoccus soli]
MSKPIKKKAVKKRAETYEPKVKFEGSFEDIVKISTTGVGAKKKEEKKITKHK